MQTQENNNPACGGFFVRLTAYIIDMLLIGTILLVVKLPMFFVRLQNPQNFFVSPILFQFSLVDILLYLAAAAYFIVLTYYTGSTVGKRLMNLRVVSTDGAPLTLLNVIYRETIGRYLSSLLFVGYILIAVNDEKRGLHDILCNTKVIYTCKCAPRPPKKVYQPMPAYGQYAVPQPPMPVVPQTGLENPSEEDSRENQEKM